MAESLVDAGNRRRAARVVTELFAPAQTAIVLLILVAVHSAPSAASATASGLIAAVLVGVVPYWYVRRGVRQGRWANHHVPQREQRRRPLLAALTSAACGLVVLLLLGAARELLALIAAMCVGLAVSVAVSHFWKMSIHTAVVSGAAVVLGIVFGPIAYAAWLVVASVGWSRVEVGDHTLAQVLAGGAIGAAVAGAAFPLLR